MAVDLNQIMKLMSDPTVQKLVQGLLGQLSGGKGGAPNMAGLMDQLDKAGLGQQAQSWVGTGQNEPVTGAQLQQALGGGMLEQAAADAGTTPRQAADDLAKVLPGLIDQATPNGQMPDPQQMQQMIGKFMGGAH
ncbi:YidB family protein [Catellatospora sp. KI3]|uniref:YidB family protein n=1 Tax=Catellatospora sp. KI3 TaxID=3041620 RepID=UPI002482FF34|nr:YidB family protein [Catellatospora sp. KI3]MDI1462403.1 YidB family protein [Catellatospora sp. KI3]